MQETIHRIENLLAQINTYCLSVSIEYLNYKAESAKWSKKEILGHLVDSAMHNLHRFIEIQYEPKPYKIRTYNQVAMVSINNYQHMKMPDLQNLLTIVNSRILEVLKKQTNQTLSFEIILDNNKKESLDFLIKDYVKHLEHHSRQILSEHK